MAKRLQKCGSEAEMREVVGRICRNYLHGLWKVVCAQELKFKRISGGLSNFIYMVGLPDDTKHLYMRLGDLEPEDAKAVKKAIESGNEPKQVLLRIYGQVHGERAMDAIVTESVIFTLLSERNLGPKLFGVFSGGRIEEYIPARPLTTKELSEPAISMKIAEKTAAIHSMEIPLSKEPNYLWKTMCKWLRTVKDEVFSGNVIGKNCAEDNAIKHLKAVNYEQEIEWVRKYLIRFDSPVVFCHNDLQEGNILLLEEEQPASDEYETQDYLCTYPCESNISRSCKRQTVVAPKCCTKKCSHMCSTTRLTPPLVDDESITSEPSEEPKLYLIDFEYCAYNYRAFDLANHFQEWAYDYTNPEFPFYFERQEDWPTLEQKEIFIRQYLKYIHKHTSEDKQPLDPDIEEVNKLLAETEAFALASHLFWTLWSIVNASKSQIPFGYWEYGRSRLQTYQRLKQEIIKKDQNGVSQKRKIQEVDI